jgi:fibronectin-binding autotransporter adhesin
MILQLNLLATDFFHAAADPSYLLYNPYNTQKTVQVNVGSTAVNVYDAISGQFLATDVSGLTSISIPGESSRSLVYTPFGGSLVDNGTNVSVNGVVVNYRSPELNRLYWDLNGSTAGAGGTAGGSILTGTWDSGTTNFNPSSAGTGIPAAWISGRVAMFAAGTDGGGTYTVAVSGTQSIGGLYFQTGNVTLQGGNFSLASDSTVTAVSGTQTINTPIAGAFALLKDGSGTVILGAANTYTGITTIENGVLQLGNALALENTNVDVDVNNGLNINSLNATLGGLSGSGNVNISNQTLTVGYDNQNAEYAGLLSGTGIVIKVGGGIWTLDGPNNYSGGTLFQGGEISVSSDTSLGAAGVGLSFDGGTLQVTGTTFNSTPRFISMTGNGGGFDIEDPNNTFTIAQNLTGGTLSKFGAGTLALTGNNSQFGLTLNNGTLYATTASNLGAGPITFSGASTLSLGNAAALTVSTGVNVNASSTLNLSGAGIVTFAGPLAMNANLVQTGGGTLQLTSLPSGSGSITLRAGTLQANMNSNWAIGGTSGAGGIYIADSSSNSTDNQTVLLGSGVTMSDGRLYFQPYALSGTKTLGTNSASGVATINTYIELESGSINLQLTAAPGGLFNLPLGILGSTTAGITVVGGGTVSLGGIGAAQSEYYEGTTTVQNGTLLLTGNDIIGNARDTYVLGNSSYTLAVQIGNSSTPVSAPLSFLTDAAVTINHNISVNNFGGSIFVGGASANASTFNSAISLAKNISLTSAAGGVVHFNGAISGSGGITASGAGTVNLSGADSYAGTTNVSSGATLVSAVTGALPSGTNVTNNGALVVNGNATLGSLTGTGSLSISPASGTNTVQLAFNSGQAGEGGLSIAANSALDITNNHMFISYAPGTQATADATIRGYLINGRNGGTWNGTGGINSSVAALPASSHYGIGYADGADGIVAGLSSGQIEVKYTLLGDADLDGSVTGSDFTILASNLGKSGVVWDQGDFDYDGAVTGVDFTDLIGNLGKSASGADVELPASDYVALDAFASANGLMADVPEPASAGLLLAAGLCFMTRRRRSA